MATSIIKKIQMPEVRLQVVDGSKAQSVTAGTAGDFFVPVTIPSGYSAVCVAGVNVGYSECSVNICEWTGLSVHVQVRNNHTSTLNVTVKVKLLCVKY